MKCDRLLEIVVKERSGGNSRLPTICSKVPFLMDRHIGGWQKRWCNNLIPWIDFTQIPFFPFTFSVEKFDSLN